jgi:tetraprenyl-beta-curcumene synthase
LTLLTFSGLFPLFSLLPTCSIDPTMTPERTAPAPSDVHAASVIDRITLAATFTAAARSYWTSVFPRARRELEHWRERGDRIPDPVLRALALEGQCKRGNLEGAAAFAAFVPRAHRAATVRAMVAYQSTYNYLDVLAEQPYADPVAGARGLHQALLDALDPTLGTDSQVLRTDREDGRRPRGGRVGTGSPDYYARYPQREDGGYLAELVQACQTALGTLPSYAAVAPAALRASERIVEFQSLNLAVDQGDHEELARWARTEAPLKTELEWWEAAAAGGSSLGVYALIAAASAAVVDAGEVQAIEDAYFPWIGALHSLLDHLVDRSQDAAIGQRNLIDYYATPEQAAERMRALARRAAGAARALPQGDRRHTIVLAGMAANYLSDPGASAPEAAPIAQDIRAAIGGMVGPALVVFKARRLAGRPEHARLERFRGSSSAQPGRLGHERDAWTSAF